LLSYNCPFAMSTIQITPASSVNGLLAVPGDKSISHRAIILGALAEGTTCVEHLLESDDSFSTIEAFRKMGVSIQKEKSEKYLIKGVGLKGLSAPRQPLEMGESGTTMRLLLGVLAGQSFQTTLVAKESLARRPMLRVVSPLRQMGARVDGKDGGEYAPITIQGGDLQSIHYESPIASAQVKSAILLAGLFASGKTLVSEPYLSRDHTERMLSRFGVGVHWEARRKVSIQGPVSGLKEQEIFIPGDFSSAAFFIVAASLVSNFSQRSNLVLKNVSLNPTRTGLLQILEKMGARIQTIRQEEGAVESMGDLQIESAKLKGTIVPAEVLPSLIDEVPILMVAACLAEGTTTILGTDELRVKETDRITSMTTGLTAMGAKIEVKNNDLVIEGVPKLHGVHVDSYGDHRTAMSLMIAGLVAEGQTTVEGVECVAKSFPTFMECLNSIRD